MPALEIGIRPAESADEAFIFDSWLKGARRWCREFRPMRDEIFFPEQHAAIERALIRGKVSIAHFVGDTDTILGYLVTDPCTYPEPVLCWVAVKLPWRQLGIATRLIETALPDPNRAALAYLTDWRLGVVAPGGLRRAEKHSREEARKRLVRRLEENGQGGGDSEALLRKWPGMKYFGAFRR